ncbi:MAG: hypothetical protein IH830_03500 [Planctomycetes bacterium]|nr:hypothetical protein [Planctomycetota bacterium]
MNQEHLTWPPERFFWAVLDASVLSSARTKRWRRSSQRLGYLFEGVLPGLAIEEVHAVYRRLRGPSPGAGLSPGAGTGAGQRFLACGLTRSVLEQEVDPQAVTLTPGSLPSFVEDEIELDRINLLTGSFLAKPVRLLQRRWLLHGAVILIACTSLIIFGLERRVHGMQDQINGAVSTKGRLVEQLLGPAPSRSGAPLQPGALRLTAELRRLQQTRSPDVAGTEMVDCSAILSDVLVRWPKDVHALTDSLSVTPTSITIRAAVPSMADAQRLADAFVALPGWRLHQPQSEARQDHVDVTLRLQPHQQEALP